MSGLHDFLAAVRAELGHSPDADRVQPGQFTRFSTNGKPGNRDGWLKWFADGHGGCYGCKRQQISASWQSGRRGYLSPSDRLQRAREREAATARHAEQQRQQWAENARRNARTWAACRPLHPDDVACAYLRHRLRALPEALPAALRFHPGLSYWHDGQSIGAFPALVGAVTGPAGELVALHRTYLDPSGRKATLPEGAPVKKLSGASGPIMGACVRLGDPTEAGLIGVAEGVETALAASMAGGLPVVAAYSAGALAAWQWPPEARHIAICGDNDPAGLQAADALADRALSAGLRVHRAIPSQPGMDWCDVWASRDECPDTPEKEGAAHA
jgi:phage/plasmid primase-like uncharacterized protein